MKSTIFRCNHHALLPYCQNCISQRPAYAGAFSDYIRLDSDSSDGRRNMFYIRLRALRELTFILTNIVKGVRYGQL